MLPDTSSTNHLADSQPPESPWRVWRTLLGLVLPVTVGTGLAMWLHAAYLLPRLGVGNVQRIVDLGRLTGTPFSQNSVVILGNSIMMEGISAPVIERQLSRAKSESATASSVIQHLPAVNVYNCSIGGCGINEQRILLPRLLKAGPRTIVIALQPDQMGYVSDLNIDKAFAYGLGDFATQWPKSWNRDTFSDLANDQYDALVADKVRQLAHFRNAPLNQLNETVRRRTQSILRTRPDDDWRDPHEMVGSLPAKDPRLAQHLDTVRKVKKIQLDSPRGQSREGKKLVEQVLRLVADSPTQLVLLRLPIHPDLRDDYAREWPEYLAWTEELSRKFQAPLLDASDLLDATDFADAVHPNAAGRERLSAALGDFLAAHPPATTTAPPVPAGEHP
ncbi:MAG: hypothetical protein SFX18_16050 [Pirellulales bacterium]|nr:hypothetical protein [Pirellulales bacterium]